MSCESHVIDYSCYMSCESHVTGHPGMMLCERSPSGTPTLVHHRDGPVSTSCVSEGEERALGWPALALSLRQVPKAPPIRRIPGVERVNVTATVKDFPAGFLQG